MGKYDEAAHAHMSKNNPINMLQTLEGNMNFLTFLAKYLSKRLIEYAHPFKE